MEDGVCVCVCVCVCCAHPACLCIVAQRDFMTPDQFIHCFEQATVDVEDDALYFAVRETYDIVPLPRKAKAMLSNLHNQCRKHNATFTPAQVKELCEKVRGWVRRLAGWDVRAVEFDSVVVIGNPPPLPPNCGCEAALTPV